jgi:hypothetical protein
MGSILLIYLTELAGELYSLAVLLHVLFVVGRVPELPEYQEIRVLNCHTGIAVLWIRDPVHFFRPLDPGWVKIQDHISENLENKFFWVKILKFFDVDPGSSMEKIRI